MGPRDLALPFAALVLTTWVGAFLWRRRLYREFPFFCAYVALTVVVSLIRFSVSGDYNTYFYVFWVTEAIYAVAAILALHEAFRKVFFAFYELWWWFRLVFPAVTAFMAFIAIRNAIEHPALQGARFLEVILALARGVNYLEAVLFGVFFGLVLLLGVPWRSYPFGIVEGFGMYALGAMIAFGLRSEIGKKYDVVAKYLPPVAYIVGALIWLDTFRQPPDPEPVWRDKVTPQQMLEELRSYLRVLKKFFGHNGS